MRSITGSTLLIRAGILLPAFVAMTSGLGAPIHGNFYFRQAHVAANIEKFVSDGLSMRPETYNLDIPYSLFDFPAYELVVAGMTRLLGCDPLVAARGLSILSFVLTLVLIDRLLDRTAIPMGQRLWVLCFFTYAPLNLFYFQTPLVDSLAICLACLSLYGLVRWHGGVTSVEKTGFWLLMTLSGVLSALIKNPVYLPFFLAIWCFTLFEYRRKFFLQWGVFAYILAIVCAVVFFKIYSNTVNQVSGFLGDNEAGEYFGPWVDRLDPLSWRRIGTILTTQTANGLAVVLGATGVGLYVRDSTQKYRSLYLGSLLGAFTALLVFFNRYTWHNYYQLPLVFPLAFFSGYGAFRIQGFLAPQRPPSARPLGWIPWAFACWVVTATLYEAVGRYPELSETPTQWIASAGEWIRYHSKPDDFVIYILDTRDSTDWNPVFLYFAKRDGYNLVRRRVRPRVLDELYVRYASDYHRILVFCPLHLQERMSPRLESAGARLLEAGASGMLYRLVKPGAVRSVSPGSLNSC